MLTIRKRLSPSEGRPPDTRYNEGTDTVETTPDGGETWNENEAADPRVNPAYLMPPNTAPDVKCAAAAGMVEDVRRVANAGIAGTGIVGIGAILLTLAVIPFWWAYLLIVAIATILFGIGAAAMAAAFTPEVYEFLLCQFEANIDADGRIDQAGFEAVQTAAAAEFSDATIDAVLAAVWQLHGAIGLSNAGVAYADPEAECNCGTWCFTVDLEATDGGGATIDAGAGSWSSGVGWEAQDVFLIVPRTLLSLKFEFGEDVQVQTIDARYDYFKVTSAAGTEGAGLWENVFSNPLDSYNQDVAPDGTDLPLNGIPTVDEISAISFFIQPAFNANGGTGILKLIQITGTGEPPAWFEANGWTECPP